MGVVMIWILYYKYYLFINILKLVRNYRNVNNVINIRFYIKFILYFLKAIILAEYIQSSITKTTLLNVDLKT